MGCGRVGNWGRDYCWTVRLFTFPTQFSKARPVSPAFYPTLARLIGDNSQTALPISSCTSIAQKLTKDSTELYKRRLRVGSTVILIPAVLRLTFREYSMV